MKQEQGISTLSLAVLGLINQQPQTGYDIRKLFSTTPLGHFSDSPGAIYPALKRIENAGWIRGRARQGKTLRERVVYEITLKGLRVLTERLSQPVTQDDVTWNMDDLMLRFAFMDPVIGREATLRFLEQFASQIEAHVTELRRYFDGVRAGIPTCGRLAMENGIENYEMNARWARRAIDGLKRESNHR